MILKYESVHLSHPHSALDVEAGKRATSTYLVQRVIPMLPPLLCEELCSLNPGVERFAFSVEWELDAKGEEGALFSPIQFSDRGGVAVHAKAPVRGWRVCGQVVRSERQPGLRQG